MLGKLKELWEAVLLRAVRDARDGPDPQEVMDYVLCTKEDAKGWIQDNSLTPGSFRWVCDLLGLEHTAVRREALEGGR